MKVKLAQAIAASNRCAIRSSQLLPLPTRRPRPRTISGLRSSPWRGCYAIGSGSSAPRGRLPVGKLPRRPSARTVRDRQSDVKGKRGSERVDQGGHTLIKKKTYRKNNNTLTKN